MDTWLLSKWTRIIFYIYHPTQCTTFSSFLKTWFLPLIFFKNLLAQDNFGCCVIVKMYGWMEVRIYYSLLSTQLVYKVPNVLSVRQRTITNGRRVLHSPKISNSQLKDKDEYIFRNSHSYVQSTLTLWICITLGTLTVASVACSYDWRISDLYTYVPHTNSYEH
jgi:hypothetical protein